VQRRLDEALGLDAGEQSEKPRAPEIPVALFREVIRPLGALKYENQLNYFVGAFTGGAPTLQHLSSEYVFADWQAARFELAWSEGRLESLAAGYQRTLGVGPRHNWVHGFLVLTEVLVREDFVGGLAFYTFAWKPEEESPWALGLSAGANRALFRTAGGEAPMGAEGLPRPGAEGPARGDEEERSSAWRPFFSANVWYTLSRSWTVGVENDVFPHHRFGEYLVLPNVTWRPTEHFFVQLGAGYYQLGSDSQATLMCRVNLLNPSPRKPREEREGRPEE
jgi:hypothetical protein